jgi:caudovirus prohead protease|nr:MAG TPA: prohead serine protease [Caudoviricetes sp.]DAI03580.1 MAG TPA: prohead serine protease [Caudoviricetes sp.]
MEIDKEIRKIESEIKNEDRHVSGYAIRFNEESNFLGFYEVILPSAIDEDTLKRSDIFALLNHDSEKVLARCKYGVGNLKLTIDNQGLKYDFDVLENELGDTVLSYIRSGIIDSSSFSFSLPTNDDECQEWKKNVKTGKIKRYIKKIDKLYDVSPVYQPAYSTATCSCRSYDKFIEEEKRKKEELTKKYDDFLNEINKL